MPSRRGCFSSSASPHLSLLLGRWAWARGGARTADAPEGRGGETCAHQAPSLSTLSCPVCKRREIAEQLGCSRSFSKQNTVHEQTPIDVRTAVATRDPAPWGSGPQAPGLQVAPSQPAGENDFRPAPRPPPHHPAGQAALSPLDREQEAPRGAAPHTGSATRTTSRTGFRPVLLAPTQMVSAL